MGAARAESLPADMGTEQQFGSSREGGERKEKREEEGEAEARPNCSERGRQGEKTEERAPGSSHS